MRGRERRRESRRRKGVQWESCGMCHEARGEEVLLSRRISWVRGRERRRESRRRKGVQWER